MTSQTNSRIRPILTALFVTVLWSSSWILVKIGLKGIPSLTFAGLRYVWAFLVLLPFALRSKLRRSEIRFLSHRDWLRLSLLGIVFYAATQGMIYVALEHLQAATLSLMLNFSSVVVATLGILWLHETPTGLQWVGLLIYLGGTLVYFYPLHLTESVVGLLAGGGAVMANAVSSMLGREINRARTLSPLTVTVVSMGAGSLVLLALGIVVQGLPRIDLLGWLIIGWLAIVNSAFAFTLWNSTQRTLSATESSVINNTMLIQIAVLAWVFLGENLNLYEIIGLALAALGILFVQLRKITARKDLRYKPGG